MNRRMIKTLWLLAIALLASPAGGEQGACRPLWKTDLQQYGFNEFGAASHSKHPPAGWQFQEGPVLITPDLLAVYQVISKPNTALAPRDPSGGAGRFTLLVEFFDAKNAKPTASLHLQTSAEFSKVFPTHDRKFLVRTGNALRLYSAGFDEVASRDLPLSNAMPHEHWRIAVFPSGKKVYAQHNETSAKTSRTEGNLLDADTLRTLATFDTDDMFLEPVGDSLLLGAKDYGTEVGQFKINGEWRSLFRVEVPGDASCFRGRVFVSTTNPLLATFGCNILNVLSLEGKQVLTSSAQKGEEFVSAVGAGAFIAAEVHRHSSDPFDLGISSKPLRIVLYDLSSKSERCNISITQPVSTWSFLYGLSSTGNVAVLQGHVLGFYQP